MKTTTKVDWGLANCIGIDTDMFIEFADYKDARRVCSRCPIAADCYFEAVKDNLTGTWGQLWHGKPATPGVKIRSKGDVKIFRRYQTILLQRMGLTLQEFTARYGPNKDGIKKALREMEQ